MDEICAALKNVALLVFILLTGACLVAFTFGAWLVGIVRIATWLMGLDIAVVLHPEAP